MTCEEFRQIVDTTPEHCHPHIARMAISHRDSCPHCMEWLEYESSLIEMGQTDEQKKDVLRRAETCNELFYGE